MERFNFIVGSSLVGVFGVILVYVVLYRMYRERYMGFWTLGWGLLLLRYAAFDFGFIRYWRDSIDALMLYQTLTLAMAFLLLAGARCFIGRPISPKAFWCGFFIACAASFAADYGSDHFMQRLVVPLTVSGLVGIETGRQYLLNPALQGMGSKVAGYAYIGWNLMNLSMPVTVQNEIVAAIGYAIGGIFRISIIVGTLVVYFEQKRAAQARKEDGYRKMMETKSALCDVAIREKLRTVADGIDRTSASEGEHTAAVTAHEVRNAVAVVYGYLQYLQQKGAYRQDWNKIELMLRELERTNAIVSEYLSLLRQKPTELRRMSIDEVVWAVYPLLQADAAESKVVLRMELGVTPDLYLDENEMRQMLLHLVRNSVEAMPNGGEITISTGVVNESAVLTVRDGGIGIPQDLLSAVDVPFFTTKPQGSGLGLTICHQIALRHHAEIHMDSGREGTTVRVVFSLVAD